MTDRPPYDLDRFPDDAGRPRPDRRAPDPYDEPYDERYDQRYEQPHRPAPSDAPPAHDEYEEYEGYEEYDEYDDGLAAGGGAGRRRARSDGPGGGGRRLLTILLGVLVVGVLALGAAGVWVQRQVNPGGSPGEPRTVVVAEGSSSSAIGEQLAQEGIIASSFVWEWYVRINGGGPFQAGEYQLADGSSMGDVVATLERGPVPPEERAFTMPEGFTLRETLARLADPDRGLGLDLAVMDELLESGQVRSQYQPADEPSNEGILFPETYRVEAEADELAVLQMMVGELDATMGGLEVESAQDRFNLSPYEILIVASLIEEETKIPSERPMVARVIYNRLRGGIPLGIDATSRYEAEIEGRDRGDIDFTSSSPYNTRRVEGLPPTPIASPGRASIEAALEPADGPWIYYVLKDEAGNHVFTESNSEFLEAKEACRDAGLGCG